MVVFLKLAPEFMYTKDDCFLSYFEHHLSFQFPPLFHL